MCKHNLLIHERTLSSNQLSFEVRQCYQIKRWLEFDFSTFAEEVMECKNEQPNQGFNKS